MNPKGGTEILKEQLIAQLEPGSIDGVNLIGSILRKRNINILIFFFFLSCLKYLDSEFLN